MVNQDIRYAASSAGVHLWMVAEGLGVSEAQFYRKMRKEFTDSERARALEVIRECAAKTAAKEHECPI